MKKRKWGQGIITVITIGLIIVQCFFLLGRFSYRLTYTYAPMEYVVNSIILLLMGLITTWIVRSKKMKYSILGLLVGVLLINIGVGGYWLSQTDELVSYSPNLHDSFLLRKNKSDKYFKTYTTYHVLFAIEKDRLPNEITNQVTPKWITNHTCIVKYQDENKRQQVYVSTNYLQTGSYFYTSSAINGRWKSTRGTPNELSMNGDLLIINKQTYDLNDTKQYGVSAMVVNKASAPIWVVAFGDDFKVDTITDNSSGHIVIYNLNQKNSQPITLKKN